MKAMHPMKTMHLMKERGVAVIMVLLVLAIVAVTTAALMKRYQYAQAMASQVIHLGQTKAHIQGAEAWAAQLLTQDRHNNNLDHLGENWAQVALPMPVEQGFVSGKLTDLQGRFNLNSVVVNNSVNQSALGLFKRLLEQQSIDPKIAIHLVDWIDKNVENHQIGTLEDAYYLGLAKPYRSANQPLVDVSELGLVKGFSAVLVAQLKPFVCALPTPTRINVNTASSQVIEALSADITQAQAQQLVASRSTHHWGSPAAFIEAAIGPKTADSSAKWQTLEALVSTQSQYFELNMAAQFGVAKTRLESKLYRSDNGQVTTLSRIYTP